MRQLKHRTDGPQLAASGHDARHHRSGRAAPWFVVAAVAFVAAFVAGCGGEPTVAQPASVRVSAALAAAAVVAPMP